MTNIVEIFTDGACKGNPGPGGWAALLRFNGAEKVLSGGERQTTNNRMEMTAAIKALETLKRPCHVVLSTDSQYLRLGITQWLKNWKRRGWKTAQGKPVKNEDLWRRLDAVAAQHEIEWCWVAGHSGHHENSMVDEAASAAAAKFL